MSVDYFDERQEMVEAIRVIAQHLAAEVGKVTLDDRVLRAMAKVPRQEFVPVEVKPYAYLNRPLPIGFDKTISQPLIVAVMTDMLELRADDVVLEIGTGLGYQSAVLAELAGKVYSVEIIEELAQSAVQRLKAFCAVSAPPPNLRYAPTTQWLMAPARSAPFFTLATRCFLAKI
jgi:protein-L-isoaspartate(D-aspartate) O-methyltransferase